MLPLVLQLGTEKLIPFLLATKKNQLYRLLDKALSSGTPQTHVTSCPNNASKIKQQTWEHVIEQQQNTEQHHVQTSNQN